MRLKDLVSDVNDARIEGDPEIEIKKIEYDSRKIEPGDLFVAMQRTKDDGHRYIKDAVERGTHAVMLEKCVDVRPTCTIMVDDSKKALALISSTYYGHPAKQLRIVGITGTNGKTTVSYLLRAVLLADNIPTGLIGTTGYIIGDETLTASNTTPESLDLQYLLSQMVAAGEKAVSMEISSHALALDRVYGLNCVVAIFTNLTQDHLDFHSSLEEYFAAKALLFERLDTSQGKAVINLDDAMGRELIHRTKAEVITYGLSERAAVRGVEYHLGQYGTDLVVAWEGLREKLRINISGRFNIHNALAAVAGGIALGIKWDAIKSGIESIENVPGRFEKIECGQDFTVIVDYAHTPDALERLLTAARELSTGKIIVVFGCGGDRDRGKRPIMGRIASTLSDLAIVTSDNPRTEQPMSIIREIMRGLNSGRPYGIVPDRKEAIARALDMASSGDTVVIAGKGHETYQIIGNQKFPFDDRKIVRELLQGRYGR